MSARPPPPRNSKLSDPPPASSSPSAATMMGQIHVKLIEARALNVSSSSSRPYVVVQFEHNEFISRDPIDETDKQVNSIPALAAPGTTTTTAAVSALGKALEAANGHRSASSPNISSLVSSTKRSSSDSSNGSKNGGLFSRPSSHNPVWKHGVSFDVTCSDSLITFNLYDRSTEDQPFLGTLQIKPILKNDHTVDQWYKLSPYEKEVVTGEIRVQVTFEKAKNKHSVSPKDFEFMKMIGRGTFGRVFQVRKKDTRRIYAMKILSKKEIVAKKEVAHTIGERKILQRSLECPFLLGLKFSFQTEGDLYLVTDFKSGGELFWHLQRETRFSEERARFYVAELVLALEHLHKYDIVYRDLKPENILLDATGHIALCDFGLSKADLRGDELTNTFCGTTEYLAPEILLDEQGYSKIVDFWSLGVLLFEMCCGWSPFYAEDTQQMYKNICFGKIRFPKGYICDEGKLFVKGLLTRNPKNRLGAHRDAVELKEHPFFKTIDFQQLYLRRVTPPFIPIVEDDESTTNFDPEFTTADISEILGVSDDESEYDEADPSDGWLGSGISLTEQVIRPGPLGMKPGSPTVSLGTHSSDGEKQPKGIEIKQKKKRRSPKGSPPLTSSVQDNFRGFTFSGESSVINGLSGRRRSNSGDTDYLPTPTTDDEINDTGHSAGRYAHHSRRMQEKGLGFTGIGDD
ncbi:putative serine/threonine protein kinase [Fistulina hepatica ATCC 64428]|nr:putative serine/threonine protein kinase [Fistulina hepatica ATCC 64428]